MTDPTTPTTLPLTERIAGLTKDEFTTKNSAHAGRLKIFTVDLPGGDFDVILRPLSRAEYDKLQLDLRRARQREESTVIPMANAVRACLIGPDAATFDAQFDQYPSLAEQLATELLEMAGADAKVRERAFR